MTLWWLAFRGGSAVIVEGESLIHARALAVANELGRASEFDDGYAIDPDLAEMIPEDFIWRKLSPKEAADVLTMLKDGLPGQSNSRARSSRCEAADSSTSWVSVNFTESSIRLVTASAAATTEAPQWR
jgi:hypothetical protein